MEWKIDTYIFFGSKQRKILDYQGEPYALLTNINEKHQVRIKGERWEFDTEPEAINHAEKHLADRLSKQMGKLLSPDMVRELSNDKYFSRTYMPKPERFIPSFRIYVYDSEGNYMQCVKDMMTMLVDYHINEETVRTNFTDKESLGKMGFDLYFSHIKFASQKSDKRLKRYRYKKQ